MLSEVPFINDALHRIATYTAYVKSLEPIYNKISHLKVPFDGNFSIGFGSHCVNGLLVHIYSITDMGPVIDYIEALCQTLNKKVVRVEDYPELGRHMYVFENPDVKVMCFFDSNSTCKFVKIGEKTESVYELHCPDSVRP